MGTLLCFVQSYRTPVTQKYWALKKELILNLTIIVLFLFLYLCNIRWGHILNNSKTIFTQLIFHLRLCDQLPYVVSKEFYIHSTSVIYLCI